MNIPDYIREANNGSIAAKRYLYQQMRSDNWIICKRYLKDEQEAEDVLVDAFCHLNKSLHGFNYINDLAYYAYINRIVVHECLKRLKKQHVFLVSDSHAEDIEADDNVLDTLTTREIMEMILKLPPGYRTIFNLYVIEGYPHTEIAKMLGISEGNSWSQLSKAKKMLQKLLTAKGIYYDQQKR